MIYVYISIIGSTILIVSSLIIFTIVMIKTEKRKFEYNDKKNDNYLYRFKNEDEQIKKYNFSEKKIRKKIIKKLNNLKNDKSAISKNDFISDFKQLLKEIKTKFESLFLDILEEKGDVINEKMKISFAKINGFEYSYYKNRIVFSKDGVILFEIDNDEFKEASNLEDYQDCLTEELNHIELRTVIFELEQNILEEMN